MPVFQIRALPQKPGVDRSKALKELCRETAALLGLKAEQVWGAWEEISPGLYVEGAREASIQPASSHPPLVNLMAFEGRSPELIEQTLRKCAEILCAELQLESGNVFATYTELASGRVFTGGTVKKKKL